MGGEKGREWEWWCYGGGGAPMVSVQGVKEWDSTDTNGN